MKKRNKKYNPTSTHDKLSHAHLNKLCKNACIAQAPGQKCVIYNADTGKPLPEKLELNYVAKGLITIQHHWTVIIVTIGRFNGKVTVKPEFICVDKKMHADLLSDFVKEQHDKQMASYNQRQFLCGLWVAIPQKDFEMPAETLNAIIDDLAVLDDYITLNELEEQK